MHLSSLDANLCTTELIQHIGMHMAQHVVLFVFTGPTHLQLVMGCLQGDGVLTRCRFWITRAYALMQDEAALHRINMCNCGIVLIYTKHITVHFFIKQCALVYSQWEKESLGLKQVSYIFFYYGKTWWAEFEVSSLVYTEAWGVHDSAESITHIHTYFI